MICGADDELRAELLRYRAALEEICTEVGTSTLAHKIAREALGESRQPSTEFRKVSEVTALDGSTTATYSSDECAAGGAHAYDAGDKDCRRCGQLSSDDRIYPCNKCGKLRGKAEGGTTFTVCDACWDEQYNSKDGSNG